MIEKEQFQTKCLKAEVSKQTKTEPHLVISHFYKQSLHRIYFW